MRTINITFILFILTLYSCKKETNQPFEKNIVGEWAYIRTQDNRKLKTDELLPPPPPPFGANKSGYIFYEDKKCENKLDYFKRIEGTGQKEANTIYLGNKTQYKIENDSLKILDLSANTWQSQKIYSIVGDTLTLQIADGLFKKYARTKYKLNPNETYDKIIVSSSGCFGSCPVLDISVDKNGNVLFFGEHYNTENGFFSSKITEQDFKNIITTFKKANIQSLKENYYGNWTDDETVTISFIKNHRIIKSISDYGRQAPAELIWAYMPIRFLYQQVKLVPLKQDKLNMPMLGICFEDGKTICNLSKAESFYLLTEIIKGKEVLGNRELKYKVPYWNEQYNRKIIYTDGQFFKFADKTIDIGYNFLTENNLNKRFRAKEEYER